MILSGERPRDFYRLESGVFGERLVAVARETEATHVTVAHVRRLHQAHEGMVTTLRAQVDHFRHRCADAEAQTAIAEQRAEKAEAAVSDSHMELRRRGEAIQRLVAKNATLVSEKRRLRDALIGKKGLPSIHYRVDIDRDDVARESTVETLDAFPHKERVREALAEARRLARQQGGRLRLLRLDTAAWRAVIQLIVDEPSDDAPRGPLGKV